MSLFQESIIRKHLVSLDQDVVDKAYLRFKEVYSANKITNIKVAKEEQYQEGFIKDIFGAVLGYSVFPEQPFNIQTEKKNVADSKKADGAIFQGDNVVGVIELKDNKTKNLDAVKDQAFGYKNNHKDCSYVISSNFHKLRFYVDDATEYEEFDLYNLDKETFKRFYLYLRKEGLLDKNIPKLLREETKFHEENITKNLYKDYSSFKNSFFQNVVEKNPKHDKLLLFKKSQKFLDKVLFVLFAEDKGLITTNSIVQIVEKWQDLKNDAFDTPKPLYQLVALFFNNLFIGKKDQEGSILVPEFGGEIFAPDDVLDTLIVDDAVLKNDLLKLSKYDFNTDVDVNILGHIFEHSLSEIEEVEAELKGEIADKTKGKRKKDGVFYTPKYITKYIVENTIGKLCSEKKETLKLDIDIDLFEYKKVDGKLNANGIALYENLTQYKAWLLTLKILDPACGSGAFLNQAVNFLVQEHQFIDDLIAELTNTPLRLFDTDIAILESNIYGVDINEESIEIAKLSLWLRTAKQGRKLSNLSNNIKCGNSLIDEPSIAGDKAFNWQNEFPEVFNKGGFDVVLGNPPYGAKIQNTEIEYLSKKYDKSISGEVDTYIIFYFASLHLLKINGYLGFITPDTWLTIAKAKGLRKYIYDNSQLIDVYDRYKPFQDAKDTRCHTVIIKKSNAKEYNITIRLVDSKEKIVKNFSIEQHYLENDSAWNLYSSPKENTIFLKMEQKSKKIEDFYNIKYGLRTGDNQRFLSNERNHLVKEIKIARGSNIKRYFFNWQPEYLIKTESLPESYFIDNLLNSPKIILQYVRTNSTDIKSRWLEAALIEEPGFVPLNSTSFFYEKNSELSLKYLLIILSSELLNFYYKAHYTDVNIKPLYLSKLPVPYLNIQHQQPFIQKAELMLSLNKELQLETQKFLRSIDRKFGLSDPPKKIQEWYLLSYAEFINELAKKKIKLTLSEEAEWETFFTAEAKITLKLKVQIDRTDKEIDQMVYQLYELTDEEIKIIEGN